MSETPSEKELEILATLVKKIPNPGTSSEIDRLITENERLRADLVATGYMGNLLAVIHRDGGHYIQQHGYQKATDDAKEEWYRLTRALAKATERADHNESERVRLMREVVRMREALQSIATGSGTFSPGGCDQGCPGIAESALNDHSDLPAQQESKP